MQPIGRRTEWCGSEAAVALKNSAGVPTGSRTDTKGTGIMEERPNHDSSENRLAEILGLTALAIAALVTVIYLLGI